MAEGGGTIGRANVELGADTTKLDAGLSAAKQETVKAVEEIQKAANVAPVDESDRYQKRLEETAGAQALERRAAIQAADAEDRAARIARDRAKALAQAEAAAALAAAAAARDAAAAQKKREFDTFIAGVRAEKEAVEGVGAAAVQTNAKLSGLGSVASSIKSATSGFRGLISSITSTIGAAAGLVGIFSTIGSVVGIALKEIDSYFEKLGNYRKALADVVTGYDEITRKALRSPDATGEVAERRRVRQLADERLRTVDELYQKETEAALQLSGDMRKNALDNATYARNVATTRIEKLYNDEIKAIVNASRQKEDSAKEAAHEEERLFKASQKRVHEEGAKEDKERAEKEQKLQEDNDAERKKAVDEYAAYWLGVNEEIAKQSAELMKAQQAQFSQLRNDINGLFNSGQLEIGINRLGALMEIMVRKIGDQR